MFRTNLLQKIAVIIAFTLAGGTAASAQAPVQEKLLNGLKVLMWSDKNASKVTVKVRIHAGSAFDPQGKEGSMQLLADSLFSGQDAKDFFTEDLGGSLNIVTNYDYIEIDATAKPDSLTTVLETLSNALSNPVIDKDTTAKVRTALLARLAILEVDPAYVADQAAVKRLLGTFPYGRPQMGSTASVTKLEFADVLDQKLRFLTADNATMAITGQFDRASTMRAVRRFFGPWLKADKRVPSTFTQPDAAPTAMLTVSSPKPDAAAIRFITRGVGRGGPSFAAAAVFAKVVENRLKGLVPTTHAGDVFVRSDARILPGTFAIGLAVTRTADGTKIEANEIVPKALSASVTDAEFAAARSAVAAEWSSRDIAGFWLDMDTYRTASGEGDRTAFDKLQLSDVQAIASLISTGAMVSVLVNSPVK